MKATFEYFYKGNIYYDQWIINSIKEGKLLNKDEFFLCINIDERARRLNISKKKKYTIIEGIKLYEILGNYKQLPPNIWNKLVS